MVLQCAIPPPIKRMDELLFLCGFFKQIDM